jgi:hypothetical protein
MNISLLRGALKGGNCLKAAVKIENYKNKFSKNEDIRLSMIFALQLNSTTALS